MASRFTLTYSTMFDPPPELHARFEDALASVRSFLGAEHPMLIGGHDQRAPRQFDIKSPIDIRVLLGRFEVGDATHAAAAIDAAKTAFPAWAATPWTERVALLRRAVALIMERVYEIGAVLALEVGKNRMEALGEAQETADLIAYYCDQAADARRSADGIHEREHQCDEALWRVAGDRAIQFSAGARRRPRGRCARRRQHGRLQARVIDTVERPVTRVGDA